jgi:hypothetical protein
MSRFSRVMAAGLVVAALLAACSSSAKPKTVSNQPLSKAEYIKQSDAICSRYDDRIHSVVSHAGAGISFEDLKKTFNEQLIPLFRNELAELRSLKPPKADADRMDKALTAMSSGINTIIGLVGGAKTVADLAAISPTGIPRWKNEVGSYGMHVCGSAQK